MLLLTHECSVYSWGYNSDGELGLGHLQNVKCPERINYFDNISVIKICCGPFWSTAITSMGNLYVWGYCDEGLLGSMVC